MSSERPEYIERLRAEARGLKYRPARRTKAGPTLPDPDVARSLFYVATGNRWMELGEREPKAKMLFGGFWHQGELSILFADTNVGKSVLSVQIGSNIALGRKTGPFACGARDEKVLYIDFELSTTQFYQRYSHPQGDHEFPDNFFRAQFNSQAEIPGDSGDYDELLVAALEQKIRLVKATVLIIDNLSCLRGGTESASVALRLMNNLKSLKTEHKLSVLVLAHTPKRRNPARPLGADDLQGSKLLINLADSAFAMGRSGADKSLCYLKQIKQRNTEQLYGEDNVSLCRISKAAPGKKPGNFLHFKFEGYGAEQPHLLIAGSHRYNRATTDHDQLAKNVNDLSARGRSQRQIASELNISKGTVNNLLKRDSCSGQDAQAAAAGDRAHCSAGGAMAGGSSTAQPVRQKARAPGRVYRREPRQQAFRRTKTGSKKHNETTPASSANGPP